MNKTIKIGRNILIVPILVLLLLSSSCIGADAIDTPIYGIGFNPPSNNTGSVGESTLYWANGYFTNINGAPFVPGVAAPHNILSITHSDTTAAAVVRGDLITGQGIAATWTRLALGGVGTFLASDGTDSGWRTLIAGDIPDLSGVYVPYVGASAAVDLGAQTLTTTGNVGFGTAVGATTLVSLFSGTAAAGVVRAIDLDQNSASGGAYGIDVAMAGLKSGNTYGLSVYNAATSNTDNINKYGLYLRADTVWTGANAYNYLLYLETPSGGTNNYAIYSVGGANYLGGSLTLGTPLTIANGGTGQITKATAFDALSPMTALGDLIYGGAAGTGTRLAGNITTVQKFLSQTGDGANSDVPSWQVVPAQGTYTTYMTNIASDVAGDYKSLTTPDVAKTTFSTAGLASGSTLLRTWISEPGFPNLVFIPHGQFDFHVNAAQTAGAGKKDAQVYAELWEANAAGVDIALIGTTTYTLPVLTALEVNYLCDFVTPSAYFMASTASRLKVKVYAYVTGVGGDPTVALYYGGTANTSFAIPSNTVDATNFVPYLGATANIDLNAKEVTNGTLNAMVLKGTFTNSGVVTLPAFTLSGNITGAGKNISGIGFFSGASATTELYIQSEKTSSSTSGIVLRTMNASATQTTRLLLGTGANLVVATWNNLSQKVLAGQVSTAGVTTNNSPSFVQQATYWNGVTSVNWNYTVLNTMTATTPASTVSHKINAVSVMDMTNTNAVITGQLYGKWGIGIAQSAVLTLAAGTATAGTAPFKMTSGTLLAAPEVGAVEFLTDAWYGTITTGTARKQFAFTDSVMYVAVVSKSADYLATSSDNTILVDASGASRTITLPTASGTSGKDYTIKKTDNSANTVVVDANLAETIDGNLTMTLAFQYDSITIRSDGSNWHII